MNPDLYDVLKTKPRLYFRGGRWHCAGVVEWRRRLIPRRKEFSCSSHSPRVAFLAWQFSALGVVQGLK
jgi:hypothetical protein